MGSAVAFVLGDNVALNIVFRKEIGIRIGQFYLDLVKGILSSIFLSCFVVFAFKYILPCNWYLFIARGITVLISYLVILRLLNRLNNYEKSVAILLTSHIPVVRCLFD